MSPRKMTSFQLDLKFGLTTMNNLVWLVLSIFLIKGAQACGISLEPDNHFTSQARSQDGLKAFERSLGPDMTVKETLALNGNTENLK